MAEFSAAANLDIVVTPDSLRSARRTIERELGDVEVGVTSNRPTGSRGAVGARGPEPAGVDLSRRQLGQQETLVELAGERNELLEELLEGADGGGGGGALRTAGTLGLGARIGGAGLLGGGVAGGPFTALTAAALLFGGGAAVAGGDEAGRPGPGPDVPQTTGPFPGIINADRDVGGRASQEALAKVRGFVRNLPSQSPLAGGTININAQANVGTSESLRRSEIERFVQTRIRQAAEDIRRELERQIGSGTTSRTIGIAGDRDVGAPASEEALSKVTRF